MEIEWLVITFGNIERPAGKGALRLRGRLICGPRSGPWMVLLTDIIYVKMQFSPLFLRNALVFGHSLLELVGTFCL